MARYTLQASSTFKVESMSFDAADDNAALLLGSAEVLERAHGKLNLWSQGRITLRDSKGNLINEMPHKYK